MNLQTLTFLNCVPGVYPNSPWHEIGIRCGARIVFWLTLHLMAKAIDSDSPCPRKAGRPTSEGKGQRVGYTRVSTLDQNDARQLDGLGLDRRFLDKLSGKDVARSQLEAMLSFIREGDTLVCHSIAGSAQQ